MSLKSELCGAVMAQIRALAAGSYSLSSAQTNFLALVAAALAAWRCYEIIHLVPSYY